MNFSSVSLPLKKYIRAIIQAFIVTVILQALLSVVFSFLPPSEKVLDILSLSSPYFGAFLTAFFCGRSSEKSGGLTGAVAADIFMLILLLAGMVFFNSGHEIAAAAKILAVSSLCGLCGGIIGINCK